MQHRLIHTSTLHNTHNVFCRHRTFSNNVSIDARYRSGASWLLNTIGLLVPTLGAMLTNDPWFYLLLRWDMSSEQDNKREYDVQVIVEGHCYTSVLTVPGIGLNLFRVDAKA
ncbi:unnamed protein product [Somion occarium]|uniref:Uncharacterized protein n=1 Tax=Somion occarium TaxID=3059160 RepID=A0ABP1DVW4_9APHY